VNHLAPGRSQQLRSASYGSTGVPCKFQDLLRIRYGCTSFGYYALCNVSTYTVEGPLKLGKARFYFALQIRDADVHLIYATSQICMDSPNATSQICMDSPNVPMNASSAAIHGLTVGFGYS
jgi:hypothetical protein